MGLKPTRKKKAKVKRRIKRASGERSMKTLKPSPRLVVCLWIDLWARARGMLISTYH